MNPRDILTQGAIVTSVLTMGAFLGGLILAYAHHDTNSMSLYTGAVISNATTAVGFWLGSSAGSQKKDQNLADRLNGKPPGEPK